MKSEAASAVRACAKEALQAAAWGALTGALPTIAEMRAMDRALARRGGRIVIHIPFPQKSDVVLAACCLAAGAMLVAALFYYWS